MQYTPPNVILPEYSSYVTGARAITMDDMQRYINDPLERERLKFMNAVNGSKELDMRIAAVMEDQKRTATVKTSTKEPKIKIPVYIPVNKHTTDISFLHGSKIPEMNGLENDNDGVGSNTPLIDINVYGSNNNAEIDTSGQETGVLSINVKPAQYQLTPIQVDQEIEQPIQVPQGYIRNGMLTPYDENGVNRCIQLVEQQNPYENNSGEERGLFGSETSTSLFGPTTVSMSQGYNSSTNYMGYGTNPYDTGNIYGNYGIYGIYSNGLNPYEVQRRKEQEERARQSQEQMNRDMAKKMYKAVCSYSNIDVDQQILAEIDGDYSYLLEDLTEEERSKYNEIKRIEDQYRANYNRLARLEVQPYYVNQSAIAWSRAYCGYIENERKKIPNDVGLVEWLEKYAPAKLCEAYEMKEEQENRKNILSLCDNDEYSRALERRRLELHIDDQNVHLPNVSSGIGFSGMDADQKMKRRRAFFEQILKNRTID